MAVEEALKRLGRAIQARRREVGLTQAALAERLDTATEWVSQLERGVGAPSVSTLLKLAEGLATTPVALITTAWGEEAVRPVEQELRAAASRLSDPALRVLLAAAAALEDEFRAD